MRPRSTRTPRRAWLASVALHAAAAAGLYLLLPNAPADRTPVPAGDAPANPFSLSLALPGDEPPADALPVPRVAPQPQPVTEPGRLPVLATVPPAVPDDLQAILRELATRPTATATDFPLPAAPTEVVPAAEVRPAGPVAPAAPAAVAATDPGVKFNGGKPIHGPLPAGMVAVYLLDRSASMGLNRDTFDAARAAVVATVTGLPASARFQVLAYHATASPVVRGTAGKVLVAKDDVRADVVRCVAELTAEGNSGHEAGLKAAVACGADYVIWVTDASDEELAKAKRVLKTAAKPVAVYVARATNGAVAEPVELR